MVDSWFYIQFAETISPYPQSKKREGEGITVNEFVLELRSASKTGNNELTPTTIEIVKSGSTKSKQKQEHYFPSDKSFNSFSEKKHQRQFLLTAKFLPIGRSLRSKLTGADESERPFCFFQIFF